MILSLRKKLMPAKAAPAPLRMVPPGQRVYAIGDIHGRADLFSAMIASIDDDDNRRGPARLGTTVVLLGDLIDRGPDSAAVLSMARAWQGRRKVRIIAGNHEEMLLRSLDDLEALRALLRYGGRETVMSFGMSAEDYERADYETVQAALRAGIDDDLRGFIESFEDQIRIGDYLFVHAGIAPDVPIEDQTTADTRWIREPFLSSPADHGVVVVHGHTITEGAEIAPNRIGIDTGAYASGNLTGLGLEGPNRWLISAEAEPNGMIGVMRRPV